MKRRRWDATPQQRKAEARRLAAAGKTRWQIAKALKVNVRTVQEYFKRG